MGGMWEGCCWRCFPDAIPVVAEFTRDTEHQNWLGQCTGRPVTLISLCGGGLWLFPVAALCLSPGTDPWTWRGTQWHISPHAIHNLPDKMPSDHIKVSEACCCGLWPPGVIPEVTPSRENSWTVMNETVYLRVINSNFSYFLTWQSLNTQTRACFSWQICNNQKDSCIIKNRS